MSFFDTYQEIGGNFIKSDEKAVMMNEGIPFTIVSVVDDDANKYGPRFVVKVLLPNPETGEEEERSLGFIKQTVESRDRMLTEIQKYLASDDTEPIVCKLEQVGRSVLIRQA